MSDIPDPVLSHLLLRKQKLDNDLANGVARMAEIDELLTALGNNSASGPVFNHLPARKRTLGIDITNTKARLAEINALLTLGGTRDSEQTHRMDSEYENDPLEILIKSRKMNPISAFGLYYGRNKLIVLAGSYAYAEITESFRRHICASPRELRNKLIANRILICSNHKLQFACDYTFSSPSSASSVILGCSSNGNTDWLVTDTRLPLGSVR